MYVYVQVLFPLLDKVRRLSSSASSEKVDTSGNILIHHTRNTAQKQWAETQVNRSADILSSSHLTNSLEPIAFKQARGSIG